jgi:hypothetical protein
MIVFVAVGGGIIAAVILLGAFVKMERPCIILYAFLLETYLKVSLGLLVKNINRNMTLVMESGLGKMGRIYMSIICKLRKI